jgi:uncharacterized membrane protein
MGAIAGLGAAETAYLSWTKLAGQDPSKTILCALGGDGDTGGGGGVPSSCGSVLTGPYSTLPGTDIPLAALGLVAYSCVAFLAVSPLLSPSNERMNRLEEGSNRVALTAVASLMGIFSVFLVSLLVGVLHQSCAYCFLSAGFSVSLATLAWLGGALPDQSLETRKAGALASLGTSLLAVFVAAFLYLGTPAPDATTTPPSSSYSILAADSSQRPSASVGGRQSLLTGAASGAGELPPSVTAPSSRRAVSIADQLQALDARFYGAYWCSHCYEQKQALGREAMSRIPYVECSKEGRNPQAELCKEKKIPGYPTWEIRGTLYPGERALDELEEIILRQQQPSPR